MRKLMRFRNYCHFGGEKNKILEGKNFHEYDQKKQKVMAAKVVLNRSCCVIT